jgi:hypothetical protein
MSLNSRRKIWPIFGHKKTPEGLALNLGRTYGAFRGEKIWPKIWRDYIDVIFSSIGVRKISFILGSSDVPNIPGNIFF